MTLDDLDDLDAGDRSRDDLAQYLDPEDYRYAYDDERRVHLSAAEMMADRAAAESELLDAVDCHYLGDELVDRWGLADDLARVALVNGRRTSLPAADRAAAGCRQALALRYRHRARIAARLVCSSEVWHDRELLAVILRGRCAILAALRSETDPTRRSVLSLALSVLDADLVDHEPPTEPLTEVTTSAVSEVTHEPPPTVRCFHHQRRPQVTLSTDEPAPTRRVGATSSRDSFPGWCQPAT